MLKADLKYFILNRLVFLAQCTLTGCAMYMWQAFNSPFAAATTVFLALLALDPNLKR